MRRREWSKALEEPHEAEKPMPQVAGVRLNVGLAYYRQSQLFEAIPPFESVVREEPQALQPRYLLGLGYFFAERGAEYVQALPEFLKHRAVEPDLELNCDELGSLHGLTEDDAQAESSYRQALRLDPRLVSARLGLAKIYRRQRKCGRALAEIDAAAADRSLATRCSLPAGQSAVAAGTQTGGK